MPGSKPKNENSKDKSEQSIEKPVDKNEALLLTSLTSDKLSDSTLLPIQQQCATATGEVDPFKSFPTTSNASLILPMA